MSLSLSIIFVPPVSPLAHFSPPNKTLLGHARRLQPTPDRHAPPTTTSPSCRPRRRNELRVSSDNRRDLSPVARLLSLMPSLSRSRYTDPIAPTVATLIQYLCVHLPLCLPGHPALPLAKQRRISRAARHHSSLLPALWRWCVHVNTALDSSMPCDRDKVCAVQAVACAQFATRNSGATSGSHPHYPHLRRATQLSRISLASAH